MSDNKSLEELVAEFQKIKDNVDVFISNYDKNDDDIIESWECTPLEYDRLKSYHERAAIVMSEIERIRSTINVSDKDAIVVEGATPERLEKMNEHNGFVDTKIGNLLNNLNIVSLANSSVWKAALDKIKNHAQFASSFKTTPDYEKALMGAITGNIEGQVKGLIKKGLSSCGVPDLVSDALFSFIETINKETARAMAAKEDNTVKEFLNNQLDNFVKEISKQIQALSPTGTIAKKCREMAEEAAYNYIIEDEENGTKISYEKTGDFCEMLVGEIGKALNITNIDVNAKHQAALKNLIKDIIKAQGGAIDFGLVYHESDLIDNPDETLTLKPKSYNFTFKNGKIPKLIGARDGFAEAINEYLKVNGGTVNDLGLDMKVRYEFRVNSWGWFSDFSGAEIEGSTSWNSGTPDSFTISAGTLLDYYKQKSKVSNTNVYDWGLEAAQKLFNKASKELTSKSVTV